jgi:hypothetical protein
MKIHRLLEPGLEAMATFLDDLRAGSTRALPAELLTESEFVAPVGIEKEIGKKRFGSRLQFASYIDDKIPEEGSDVRTDKGFWAWLTLVYFDEVCPADSEGRRKPLQQARYIPEPADYRTYYRHLLAGPWRIYRAHRDNPAAVMAVLCGALNVPGEVVEQLASRQELVTSRAVMETVTSLYFDAAKGKLKRGSGRYRKGGARRLADVLLQFDRTYDFHVLGTEGLLKLLPSEFNEFRAPERD